MDSSGSALAQGRVLVVGGSVAGAATALFLARRGFAVEVHERDGGAVPDDARVAGDTWSRRGLPQFGHSHAFIARCLGLLRERAPDVLAGLLAAGATEVRLADRPPAPAGVASDPADAELAVLACRRSTFEWVLRMAALRTPKVHYIAGSRVTGLVIEGGTIPTVRGVQLEDGSVREADVVVDAGGRRTPVPDWLAAAHVATPNEQSDCGIVYYTRYYRLLGTEAPGPLHRGYTAGGSFDRYSSLVFPADNRAFSVTFGVLPEDRALTGLREPGAFDAAVAAIPALAGWVAPGAAVPLSGVAAMAGLRNQIRRVVDGDQPRVLGLHSVGDAACTTNPSHSRGCTLALVHAAGLADLIDAHRADPVAAAFASDALLDRDLAPWFTDSVEQDAQRLARWRPGSLDPPTTRPSGRITMGAAFAASHHDIEVWRAFTRTQHLLAPPDALLADRVIGERVRRLAGLGAPRLDGPTHDELVALVGSAAAA